MTNPALPQSEVISVEQQGHIATVWLDRPDKLNAMAPDFWVDFPAIIGALSGTEDVRVVVVAARGRAFTVGLDLAAFGPAMAAGGLPGTTGSGSGVADRMELYRSITRMQQTFTSLAACTKPVISAVHGYCIGAGVDLITACDIRLCSADAVFSVRETKIAMVADVGTLQRLPTIIDSGAVAELVYTGRDFGADEAKEMGLVRRVLPDHEAVYKDAMALADEIAANSPLAVQGSKAILRNADGKTITEQLDYMALWNAAFLTSRDLGEAMQAFLEKRPSDFTGT
jgi:enoyl-CoA hydratase